MRRLIGLLPLLHTLPLVAYLVLRTHVGTDAPEGVPALQWWRLGNLVSLLNEFTPFYFLPLPLWLLTALLSRTFTGLLAAAIPWLLFAWLYGGLFIPRPAHLARWLADSAPAAPAGQPVRVLTFNVLGEPRPVDGIVAIVKEAHPDVVALQELSDRLAPGVDAGLSPLYPYKRVRPAPGALGQGIWSRYPIRSEELWEGSRRRAQWQHAVLDVGGRPVHLVSLHLTAPLVGWRRRATPDVPVPVVTGERTEGRSAEVEWLVPRLRSLARGAEPAIVVGDLNLTDQTPEYRRLMSTGLADAQRQVGWGFGFTFPTEPVLQARGRRLEIPTSLVRLDHVLYSPGVGARRLAVWPVSGGSDHRPVVADLLLPR